MSESGNWCTIESDPGVFTSLIESFGVENAQLTELWSLDEDTLQRLVNDYGKVHGLIFLFKWQSHQPQTSGGEQDSTDSRKPLIGDEAPLDLFFAKQVTTNACATQAILSVLLNATNPAPDGGDDSMEEGGKSNGNLKLGPTLSSLKSFATALPPDLRGESIGTCEEIRTAHNSFARKEAILVDETKKRMATDEDDVFHFIAYVPHSDGKVYELDGLQQGPIPVGDVGNIANDSVADYLSWLTLARAAIQDRIDKYAASEIKFNLMALVKDKRVNIQSKIQEIANAGLGEYDPSLQELHAELLAEEEQRKQWKEENERRRHNYMPFCIELIRALAGTGKLPEFTDKAKERMTELRKKVMEGKVAKMASLDSST